MGLVALLVGAMCAQAAHLGASASGLRARQQVPHCPLEHIKPHRLLTELDAGITLSLNSQQEEVVLPSSGSWVTLSWQGVANPQYDDWLALYVPGDADPNLTAPSKLKYAMEAPDHLNHGSGSLRFKLINYRQGMRFAFMRGGLEAPLLVAYSPYLRFANPNEPIQGHLARTADPRAMSIQWVSWNAPNPTVQWGTQPDQLTSSSQGSSSTLTRQDMCGGIAATVGWVDLGLTHNALMAPLQPGQRYYYHFGDPEHGWSSVRSFLAPPLPGQGFPIKGGMRPVKPSAVQRMHHRVLGSSSKGVHLDDKLAAASESLQAAAPEMLLGRKGHDMRVGGGHVKQEDTVRVLLLADMGQAEEDGSNSLQEAMYPSLNTTRLFAQEGDTFSLLIHAGDLSYARGYQTQWDNFMVQIEAVASSMPYMVAPGNHERDWPGTNDRFGDVYDSLGECGRTYEARFNMPTPGPDQPWYSFDHGPIHFLVYSTEHATAAGSPQHLFIATDLAHVNRGVTPWLIVVGHRPLYVSSTNNVAPDGDQTVSEQLRADLEPLLIQHKVDLTIHGHHHSYQRTCPLVNGSCVGYDQQGVAQGPVHLVIGHAGAGLSMNMEQPVPAFIERLVVWWGYMRLEASRTRLHADIISDLDGGLMDSLTLVKV